MSSNFQSPYSPREQPSNASNSPWSASSHAGSGHESLTLPPINPIQANINYIDDDDLFDSPPRLPFPLPPSTYLPPASSSRFAEPPPSNQQALQQTPDVQERRTSEYEIPDSESDPFEDFIEGNIEYASPHPSRDSTRASSVVDLTESSPQRDTMARKRKADAPAAAEGRLKKPRASLLKSSASTPSANANNETAEVVDLSNIEESENYKDFVAKQQAEAIKQQQQEEANRPVKLAEFQCIICMDSPTDLTVTHCGHLFCSECLHQALYAGTAKKCCPVCRTPVAPPGSGKKKNGVFALEMKLMTAKKKGKQAVRAH